MTEEIVTAEPEPPIPEVGKSVVFVDNLSEDVWSFIEALESESARRTEIEENVGLSDRQYLGVRAECPRNLYFVGPGQIDPTFIQYVDSLVDGSEPHILIPRHHSGLLSQDVLDDAAVLADLAAIGDMKLVSYCSSQPLFRLVEHLRSKQVTVSTPESPGETDWQQTVGFYGTKGGLRQALADQPLTGTAMAPGVIVKGKTAIIAACLTQTILGRGVVIKTNKGHAGMGVVIIKPTDLPRDTAEHEAYINSRLSESNGYWEAFPAIVEAYIATNRAIGGGIPNVECRVNTDGQVEVLYVCGCRVRRGVFAGVEIMQQVLPEREERMIRSIGQELGRRYAAAGYRGYFDIDFMADVSGDLYISESNVRRTGGTWAYWVLRRLFGAAFLDHYGVTNLLTLSRRYERFEDVLWRLRSVIYRPQASSSGVIVASANLLKQGKLNYLVIAKSRAEAAKIEANVIDLLEKK